ncbi:MAG: ABC transporter permease [Terrisporobacter sp.]|uniref:ABC transporter permease n=1 Tax=Terrisporobacter sp. TaxID=1965305 RepID=UPI002FC88A44
MTNLEITDKIKNYIYPIVTFISMLILWQLIVVNGNIPQYLMPSPTDIIEVFLTDNANLQMNAIVTLKEAVIGFACSIILALTIGTIMDFIPIVKKCFYPLMLVSQMIPTITIAPLLIIWFGFDSLPKIIMVMTTCFFPILINFVDGIENIDKDYLNLFKTMDASKFHTFIHLKLPMSLESLFTGLKISATYAFVAATVAEWLGGSIGLGVYMVRAKSAYALDKVFASTILVIIFSLIFVMVINILKKILLRHKYKGE